MKIRKRVRKAVRTKTIAPKAPPRGVLYVAVTWDPKWGWSISMPKSSERSCREMIELHRPVYAEIIEIPGSGKC